MSKPGVNHVQTRKTSSLKCMNKAYMISQIKIRSLYIADDSEFHLKDPKYLQCNTNCSCGHNVVACQGNYDLLCT